MGMCSLGLLCRTGSRAELQRGLASMSFGSRLWLVVLFLCWPPARAQKFKAPDPGPGVVPITGTWQFHTGDDLRWADPKLNDSSWQAITTEEPWDAQGHAGRTGYA